jgi:hypothetical protein
MKKPTRHEIADIIEEFLAGKGGAYDWDDFTTLRIGDRDLDAIREMCSLVRDVFPPKRYEGWCGARGYDVLKRILEELRSES